LGSAATAVYWHVGSKDNLIALAGDHVWSEIALPDLTTVGWRTAAMHMATDLHAMLTRHLWLVPTFGSYPVFGPGKARYDDHSLAIYEAAGFTGPGVIQAVTIVFTFVLGNALGPAAAASLARRLSRKGGNTEVLMRDSMARAVRLPRGSHGCAPAFDTAAADYAAAPENSFEFGLQAILDGLEARVVASRAAVGQKARKPPIRDQHASPHRRPMAPGRRRAL